MEIKESLKLPRGIADSLRVLIKIVEAVHKSSDLKEIYDTALDLVVQLDKVNMAAIYLLDDQGRNAVMQSHRNFPADYVEHASVIPVGKGITGKVLATGLMLNIEDIHKSSDIGPTGRRAGFHGVLGLPIDLDGKTIGVIWFARYKEEKFTRSEVELLTTIGSQIAIAVSRAKQRQELEEKNHNLSVLSALAERVHRSADLGFMYDTFLEVTKDLCIYNTMALYLVEQGEEGKRAVLQLEKGVGPDYIEHASIIPESEGVTWHVIRSGEPVYYDELSGGENPLGPAGRRLGHKAIFSMPIKYGVQTMGVINFGSTEKEFFDKSDIEIMLSLGNQMGTAIAKVKMLEEARERAIELEKLYTDLKLTQDQLIQSEKLASLGQLVSSIAHEINNPLTPILGYSQMLLAQPDIEDEKRDRFLQVIHQSADKVRKIVENLLSFARKDKPQREYADVNEILESAIEFRQYQLNLENIDVVKGLDPGLPKTMLDSNQIQQVFTNIILNAYHAMTSSRQNEGRLEVRSGVNDAGMIEVTFRDTGPGIPADIQNKIFDPFFTTKPTGVGTGLGLSVSYGIIKEHDGSIAVESDAGKDGTVFRITLPVLDIKDYLGVDEEEDSGPRMETADVSNGRIVMIVEDEELVTALVTGILESDGYSVEVAVNGEEALSKVSGVAYDFIVCDIKMPQMNGKEFYRRLKAMGTGLERRILFITGDPSTETLDFIEETGNRFLSKPFKIEEFREVVKEFE
ncbi:MAG TPA: GAF domain-containing protein [Thermodesulfobacteriota bacterium]|nr:GAF domain-containing protein [Thermodesulfobacteriota bacterium]